MSETNSSYWITLVEKIVGIALIIISGIMLYYTATNTETLGIATGIFGFLGAIVLIIGIFLLIVKPPE
jgi:hypothetical protein